MNTVEIKLIHGDCFTQFKQIDSCSVDLIVADLPYGTTQCKWDVEFDLKSMWVQINRIVKDDTAILMFAQTPFDKVLGCSNLTMLKYEWIWEKSNATGFFNAQKMPLKSHENILVFYKKPPTYHPQMTTGHHRSASFKRKGRRSDIYGSNSKDCHYDSTERHPRTVLKFASDKQTSNLHPTQKPVALLEYLILTYSNPGYTILDFCMGSGTTGVACIKHNRNFIGIEKDDVYFNLAKTRIESHNQYSLAI